MASAYFTVIGNFLVRYSETVLQATDGTLSYSTTPTDKLILEYVTDLRDNVETSMQIDEDRLTLTFWQTRGRMKLNRASVVLESLDEVVPLMPWVSALAQQAKKLNGDASALQDRINRQDKLLEEMTAAKEENQNELLRRVYTVINSRVKKEGD